MPKRRFRLAALGLAALVVGPFVLLGALTSWWVPAIFLGFAAGSAPFMWAHRRLRSASPAKQDEWRTGTRACLLLVLIGLAFPGWTDGARVWTIFGLVAAGLYFETAWLGDGSGRGPDIPP